MSEQENGIPEQDSDQQISEERKYWEALRGVRSFKSWHQVPEFESSASSQDDKTFPGPRKLSTGKVSSKLPSVD